MLLSLRCFLSLTACIIAVFTVMAASAADETPTQDQIEAPTWSASYQGRIASKAVKVYLWRLGDVIAGNYCYEPCEERTGPFLQLEGSVTEATLTEAPSPPADGVTAPSGRWQLPSLPGMAPPELHATWQSSDGQREWPIMLKRQSANFVHEPAFELRLLMDDATRIMKDCETHDARMVSAIRIYRDGQLAQTLDSGSVGSCRLIQPQWVDANFDGWPDLTQALDLGAGPNISHMTWLYAPRTQRFEDAPDVLQDITSPQFDSKFRLIVSQWRGSCCSHGVDIYAWKGKLLKLVEQASSYSLPVRKSGRLMSCYIMPSYENGHVAWPDALHQTPHGLAMGKQPDADWCDVEVVTTGLQLEILAEQQVGKAPRVLSTQHGDYRKTKTAKGTLYCLNVPVFDADARKVVRVTLTGNSLMSDYCQDTKP